MAVTTSPHRRQPLNDWAAGFVVFFVALPLCLGLGHVAGAPSYLSGILSGVIGGLVVGWLSSSQTSVSGVSPGLVALTVIQIKTLGSYDAFLLALLIAGGLQILLGSIEAGRFANYIPASVVRGMLVAVGMILVLKQFPHLLGHDLDPEGEMAFQQIDKANTLTEFFLSFQIAPHWGAMVIGLVSLGILVAWRLSPKLDQSWFPAALVTVLTGVGLVLVFQVLGGSLRLDESHLIHVPMHTSFSGFFSQWHAPDWSRWSDPAIYQAAIVLAAAASLETLVNLDATDRLDPQHRVSSPSHELFAQGVGNFLAGLVGALPITSSIVRSSVNISAGAQTHRAAMIHGGLLMFSVVLFPRLIDLIPISCLAAVLFIAGWDLVRPSVFIEKWKKGWPYFIPFMATMLGVMFTDLLLGTIIGLVCSLIFVLYTNTTQPIRRVVEQHLAGDVTRIDLPNMLSFLDGRSLKGILQGIPGGAHVLLDAHKTSYIDPDIITLIEEQERRLSEKGVRVSRIGFQDRFGLSDQVHFVDHCSCEVQSRLTPAETLKALREGNERFRSGQRLTRDAARSRTATAEGQYPMAVLLSCIDSRAPTELIFDLGLGDVFSVRVAGNVTSTKILGSMEYSCAVAGAKLILVLGHTRCGAVTESVQRMLDPTPNPKTACCEHLAPIVEDIQRAVDKRLLEQIRSASPEEKIMLIDRVARRNVGIVMDTILEQSAVLRQLAEAGKIAIVGAIYDVASGQIDLFPHLLTQFDLAETEADPLGSPV